MWVGKRGAGDEDEGEGWVEREFIDYKTSMTTH